MHCSQNNNIEGCCIDTYFGLALQNRFVLLDARLLLHVTYLILQHTGPKNVIFYKRKTKVKFNIVSQKEVYVCPEGFATSSTISLLILTLE